LIAVFTYALGAVHLILTLFTNFDAGLFKIIPLRVHGYIEFIVGIALIVLAFTLFMDNANGRVFYTCFGLAVLLTWLFTDYKNSNSIT
jgi:ABC-type amino acid transport system permease subunit